MAKNPIVIEKSSYPHGTTILSGDEWKRPYQILEHSENILLKETSEFERADVITNLRKAIDQRIRLIDKRYSLRSIPIKSKPSDYVELLEFLGIVRPKMLRKLIEIRNVVEHEDVAPPNQEECEVLLEFIWYFLRSTDLLTQRIVDTILFEELDDEDYWIEINLQPPDSLIPNIRGWVPANLVSMNHVDNWIALKTERVESAQESIERLNSEGSKIESIDYFGSERKSDDIHFIGEIRGSEEILKNFYKFYFNLI